MLLNENIVFLGPAVTAWTGSMHYQFITILDTWIIRLFPIFLRDTVLILRLFSIPLVNTACWEAKSWHVVKKVLFEIITISHWGGYFNNHLVYSQQCHDSIERWPFVPCCLWCAFSKVQLGLMVSINYFWNLLVMTPEKSWLLLIDSSADASVRQPPLLWVLKTFDFHYCLSGSPQCPEA